MHTIEDARSFSDKSRSFDLLFEQCSGRKFLRYASVRSYGPATIIVADTGMRN